MAIEINYLAVLLAGIFSMVVGSIWYSMGVFGKTWVKLAKVDMDKKVNGTGMVVMLGLAFVISLITAFVLAHLTFLSNMFFGNSYLQDALTTALWVWLAFTAGRFATHDLFEGRDKKLTLLNICNELVTIMAMGLIIGLMGI